MKKRTYFSLASITLLFLITFLLCRLTLEDDNSLSTVENKVINKITNLLLSQLEARSIDLSIPQLMKNITPTIPFSPENNENGGTFVCGTASQFQDRIKLDYLEHLVGYLRDANGNLIGHWSATNRCYLNLQNIESCIYPMGTFYTNCASNSLLTLLPTRNMFYHLSLVSTLKSDLIQMVLQEKRLFILSQQLETIVIWGRDAGMDPDMFSDKVLAFKLELRSLQSIYNEIVNRYRDALYQYVNQFDIYYNLNEDTSLAFSTLKTFINPGRYNLINSTLTFNSQPSTLSCLETLKNALNSERVVGKTFHLVASFCGSIEFIDRHNSIISQLMDIVENKFSETEGIVTEQLATLFIQGDAIVQESEFDFLNEYYQEGTTSFPTMPDPQLSISFGYSILSGLQNSSKTLVLSPDAIEIQIYDPTMKNKPGTIFHSDSQLQASIFDVEQLINSMSWTRDSNIENDYKNILTSLLTTSSSARSLKSTNSEVSNMQSNSFTVDGKTSKLRTTRSTTTYNCEKGRYGPNCKQCSPGNYSPGDGLLYVCNNGPINQVIYTQSGESSENCAFKCKDIKKYRVGNTCQSIPIGFYSKDGGEELAPCTLKGNSFGILDESLQQEYLTIISSGSQNSESSCQLTMKKLLSIPNSYTKGSFETSFTISLDLKLVDFNQFNFILKNYKIGYGIISFSDWIFQMNLDPFSSGSYKSIYMQVKKNNSTETFLISTSFAYDTDWHSFTLQYDEPNKILSLYRDNSIIGTCYFSLNPSSTSSFIIGGFVEFNSLNPTMFFPGMISNFKLYNSMLGNQILDHNYFTPQTCSSETSVLYGNGKCLTLSCPDPKMIQEPSTATCICPFGRFFNKDTSKCQACPMESTTGSLLPRTSIKDCQCLPDYIYSTKYETCVLAKSSLSPPSATFQFSNALGSYKELESTILSQMYYPIGEMIISFSPIEFESSEFKNDNETNAMDYVYNLKLIFNQTRIVWSYAMNLEELQQFTYQANVTGDYDLSMSTDCDGHRAGLLTKLSFHMRERDLQPLIKPKPTDYQFDSPFQLRLLQPYKTKTSIVILCYGREETNMTCLEYDNNQLYIFGPPLYVKTFSYGPNFQRLPGPIISHYYERTYSQSQLSYMEKLKVYNENLAKKQENLKENEEKKKQSVLYQVFNPFVEWFLTYPNYLWFPIVSGVLAIGYVILLVVIRLCIARRINQKRKDKVKQYLKEKKDMEEYLKQFLPPPLREKGFDDADELLESEDETGSGSGTETDESDSNNEESSEEDDENSESGSDEEDDSEESEESNNSQNDSSDSESSRRLHKNRRESNIPKREHRITIVENHHDTARNIPSNRSLPPRPNLTRFKEESLNNQVDVKLQNIGASRNRLNGRNNVGNKPLPSVPGSRQSQSLNRSSNSSEIIEQESNRNIPIRKKPLPKQPPQTKKEKPGPKYLLCGDCGGIARFWCCKCSKYMCIQCNQKDASHSNETCKSKVMVCDYCLQPRSELREVFLKGNSQIKMYSCKLCLEELYEDRKINRVGSVLKRCTKCMDEEISKKDPESRLCANCIYFME